MIIILAAITLVSCSASTKFYDPQVKFSVTAMQQDYDLFRAILEERHPGLYWYAPKTEIDEVFDLGRASITAPMTESGFRRHLALVTACIGCGHTSVLPSKAYQKYTKKRQLKTNFPLYIKTWNDTIAIAYNVFPQDTVLLRGNMIDSINGISSAVLLNMMRAYLPADGGNRIAKDQLLSTGNYFGTLYTALLGSSPSYRIAYRDSAGAQRLAMTFTDTAKKAPAAGGKQKAAKAHKLTRVQRLHQVRSLEIDSTGAYALISLNSFAQGYALKSFFRRSFKKLNRGKVNNLIVDLRSNGGGRLANSNLFTRYITDKPYRLADSLYTLTRRSKYSRYIKNDFWIKLTLDAVTHKKQDSRYHYTYFTRHHFKPHRRNHFNGNVYLLSGGNSFSATAMTLQLLSKQDNVCIVGEPSGGTAYGNTAFMIPDVTLPRTHIRFRLPLFRYVASTSIPKNGQGVQPKVYAGPTLQAIREGRDYKMEKVMEMIRTRH